MKNEPTEGAAQVDPRIADVTAVATPVAETTELTVQESLELTLHTLFDPDEVVELRAFPLDGKWTHSGYFDNHAQLVRAAERLNGYCSGVHVVANPVNPDLLARCRNAVRRGGKLTGDKDVIWRRWILVDLDPCRLSGISSTDEEHEAALNMAAECKDWLASLGLFRDSMVLADSGNGAHLLIRVDLPNDDASKTLVNDCLRAIDLRFTNDLVEVDRSTGNAAQLTKFYGTLACKGDHTEDRPHRNSCLLEVPHDIETASEEQLRLLVATMPEDVKPPAQASSKQFRGDSSFDIEAWIEEHDLSVASTGPWDGGRKWILNQCPWKASHKDQRAGIFQFPNGAIAASCRHGSCHGKGWHDMRDAIEPGWRERRSQGGDDGSDANDAKSGKESQATKLIMLADDAELFHTADHEAFATVEVDGHFETWALRSKSFDLWLSGQFYKKYGGAVSKQVRQDALGTLGAKAQFDGEEQTVFIRLAEQDGKVYLDLCDPKWRVVEIDDAGWRVREQSPVKFRRTRAMTALPIPQSGGTIDDLRPFVNVGGDDWILLVAWLFGAFQPKGPYAVLGLHGEQGSAKSTAARVLKSLIDPNTSPLRAAPKKEHDLIIAAKNCWVVTFDNLSYIKPDRSDALCRMATGGGFATRELYSDFEEIIFEVQRPIILNGIGEVMDKSDLLDRAIMLNLPTISAGERKAESDFWSAFDEVRPKILGALLNAVSMALLNRKSTSLDELPRLADFARWVTAAEPALGLESGVFMAAYNRNRAEAHKLAIMASPVGTVILEFMSRMPSVTHTATKWLDVLKKNAGDNARDGWPQSPNGFSKKLRQLAPNLRAEGIEVIFNRISRRRDITLENVRLAATRREQTVEPSRAVQENTGESASLASPASSSTGLSS